MLQYLNQRRGQSTLEYAVLVVVIIGALLAVNVYIKRGVQGRLKSSSDDIGEQFSPNNTNAITWTKRSSNTMEVATNLGTNSSLGAEGEKTDTYTNSVILNTAAEDFGH